MSGRESKNDSLTIAFFTGSYPPDACGVGDHTHALVCELERQGAQCRVLRRMWLSALRLLFTPGRGRHLCVVYPTARYGKSLAPHAAAWAARLTGWRVSCLMHECSTLNRRARVAARLIFRASRTVFFTTQREIDLATAEAPWLRGRTALLPISSNAPQSPRALSDERNMSLVYFGFISPGKGIEQFLEARALLPEFDAHVIGALSEKFPEYWRGVERRCAELNVQTHWNAPLADVSELLARARVALLPFPDGVSQRRGSALAALLNGAIVIATPPLPGSEKLAEICLCRRSAEEMAAEARRLLTAPASELSELRRAGVEYAASLGWPAAARRFVDAIAGEGRS